MPFKSAWSFLKQVFSEWNADNALMWSAALAYYTLFSIAPVLLIAIAIAGLVFGAEAAQGQIMGQMRSLVGADGATAIQELLQSANKPRSGIISTVLGFLILLWGASGVFSTLQQALHTMFDIRPKPRLGIMGFARSRFVSIGMVLGIGFILLASLVVSAGLSSLWQVLGAFTPLPKGIFPVLDAVLSIGVITVLFAVVFKFLPEVVIAWRDTWIGSAITAVLFTIGKWAIGLYLGTSNVASAYGSLGSIVVLIIWVNYSALILFFGAEFTQVYANKFGKGIRPNARSEKIESKEESGGQKLAAPTREQQRASGSPRLAPG